MAGRDDIPLYDKSDYDEFGQFVRAQATESSGITLNPQDEYVLRQIEIIRLEFYGAGAYGDVYRGEYINAPSASNYEGIEHFQASIETMEKRWCVVKYFNITNLDESELRTVLNEGEAMHTLKHSNIIEIHQILYVDHSEYVRHSHGIPLKRQDIVYSKQTDHLKSVPYPEAEFISESRIMGSERSEGRKNLFIIMEYGEIGTLKGYISQKTKGKMFSENETKSYVSQLISGLKYIHENSRIHRDIHSENIVVCKSNERIVLKYADFGRLQIASLDEFSKEMRDDTRHLIPVIQSLFQYIQWKPEDYNSAYEMIGILDTGHSQWWKAIERNRWLNT